MFGFGDNSVQAVPVNATGVRRLEVDFPGSGGIPAVISCRNQQMNLYTLGDKIWDDGDGDGIQDENEPGIPDVELELRVAGKSRLVSKATTDSSGVYQFNGLPAGTYEVTVANSNFAASKPLNGAIFSPANVSADNVDSDFNSSTKKATATVPLNGGDNLDVDGGFVLASGGGALAAETVTITRQRQQEFPAIEIAWLGKEDNTWNYRVREVNGRDLEYWSLGMVNCLDEEVSGYSPAARQAGVDGGTGFNGLKWTVDNGFSEAIFSFTLNDDYAVGAVPALAKNGKGSATQMIAGPDCSQASDGGNGGDGGDGGPGDDGEPDACEFRWVDWDGGTTSNLELKEYMNMTQLSGSWRIGDEIQPGPKVSNSSLINSSLTARLGDEFIIPLSEWNGVGYVVCGFAEVRLLDHDLGSNPIRMSVQFLKGMSRSGDTDPSAR